MSTSFWNIVPKMVTDIILLANHTDQISQRSRPESIIGLAIIPLALEWVLRLFDLGERW